MLFRWDEFDPTFNAAFGFGPIDDFRRRVERVIEELDRDWRPEHAIAPVFADRGDALELVAEVPGVEEADVTLTLNQDVLTLGLKRTITAPEGYKPHRRERAGFQATRSYALPCRVDPEKVRAVLKDGILSVRLQKAAESLPRRVNVITG